MSKNEPAITQIASYFATRLPADGVPHDEAVDAWRETLRQARRVGAIDRFAGRLAARDPGDNELQARCAEVCR